MNTLAALLMITLSLMTNAIGREPCKEFTGVVRDRLDATLEARDYELIIVATEGSREGARTVGLVRLLRTSGDDRSPRTGEPARDHRLSEVPLYGWTDADLEVVGAPLCSEEPHPAPYSRDPVYPGVLVHQIGVIVEWLPKQPQNAPVLTIGTLSNLRNGEQWLDGCGIGLFVQAKTDAGFVGHWEEWGVVRDGKGYFCLSEVGSEPSN